MNNLQYLLNLNFWLEMEKADSLLWHECRRGPDFCCLSFEAWERSKVGRNPPRIWAEIRPKNDLRRVQNFVLFFAQNSSSLHPSKICPPCFGCAATISTFCAPMTSKWWGRFDKGQFGQQEMSSFRSGKGNLIFQVLTNLKYLGNPKIPYKSLRPSNYFNSSKDKKADKVFNRFLLRWFFNPYNFPTHHFSHF